MTDNMLKIWGHEIPLNLLSPYDTEYLEKYRNSSLPSIESLWAEMDRIWDQLGLNNLEPMEKQPVGDYYSHPVWLINGLFSAIDDVSYKHREAIAQFVHSICSKKIADYGGGFGQLAIQMAKSDPASTIEIIEPYPSKIGYHRISQNSNIQFCPKLNKNYDILICQDVLEHVEDPITLALDLIASVKIDGYLIFANCFYGSIKCHLPITFHLRHTFPWVMKAAGLDYIGVISGANHAQIYKKAKPISSKNTRRREDISKYIGPVLNIVRGIK